MDKNEIINILTFIMIGILVGILFIINIYFNHVIDDSTKSNIEQDIQKIHLIRTQFNTCVDVCLEGINIIGNTEKNSYEAFNYCINNCEPIYDLGHDIAFGVTEK